MLARTTHQDPESVKPEHATYEFGALERFEIALTEFLLKDEKLKNAVVVVDIPQRPLESFRWVRGIVGLVRGLQIKWRNVFFYPQS
jgi:hypothetical protein